MAGRRHPGFVALDKCEKQVKITIRNHLDEIATFLKDSNIIDHTLYNDVTNPESREIEENKAKKLFMRLQCMVEENEDYYHKFVEFLRKNEVFEKIVALLDEAYTGKIPEPESVRVPASSNGGAGNFSEMVDGPVETDEAAKEKQQGEKPLKDKECKEIKIPKPKQDDLHYGEFCKRVQYVFSIVNNDEFNAATTMIMAPDIEDGSDVITTIDVGVYIGMMGSHPVGLIRHEPGRNCAESLTEGIKNFPNAEYLVAVGVCYGFSRVNTELADVLISKKIIDLGSYRISENSIEIRGDHTNMKDEIYNIFCVNADQVEGLQVAQDRYAKHLVGKIASGPNLVDNADFKEKINFQVKPKAYGGEMEGGELLRLQKDGIVMPDGSKKYVQVIVIKAVTDYADGTKNKEWQFIGAQAAFHYVKSKMDILNVKYPKPVIKKEVKERTETDEQKEEKTGLPPDNTLLEVNYTEDEKIKEVKEEAEPEDYSLYAYPILPRINVADDSKKKMPGFSSENTISFIYNGDKGCLNWKENGLVLLFEDSDLPLEDAKCPLLVSVGEAGAFRYPDKVESASKVYHINSPKNLHASVKIRIYHDVPEDNIQQLCFVTCSEDQPPYDYVTIHGGNFTSKYGEVDVRKFSMYGLGLLIRFRVKGLLSLMEKSYVASMYRSLYPRHTNSGFSWNIYISVVKNCSIFQNSIQVYIKEEYKDDVELISTDVVRFNASESRVTVTCEPLHEVGSLESLGCPSLRMIDISRFVDARPPHFKYVLDTKPECRASSVKIKFVLHGLEEPNNYFNLHHIIPEWSPPGPSRVPFTSDNPNLAIVEERSSTISSKMPLKGNDSNEIKSPKKKQGNFDYTKFYGRVEYVLSIVNDNEFSAATTMITAPDREDGSGVITNIGQGVFVGMIGNHPVGLIRHKPGRYCVEMLKKGINNFPKAKYLVAVGICYGFRQSKTELGDVVISKKIIDLGNCRMSTDSIKGSGNTENMKDEIHNIFCVDPKRVTGLEVEKGRYAKHLVEPIVSYPNLVDNINWRDNIYRHVQSNAYGGEMEGGELLRLKDGIVTPDGSNIQVIVIKAVTDYADGTKDKKWQFIGAQAAFHYVKSKMVKQPVKYPKPVIKKDGLEADGSVELAEETQQGGPDLMADSECTPPPLKRKRIQLFQGIGRSAKDTPTLTRELNVADDLSTVHEYLFEAKVKWYCIGMRLKVKIEDLDAVEATKANMDDRLLEMIKIWLQKGTNKTWQTVIAALENKVVGRPDVAIKIKENLGKSH